MRTAANRLVRGPLVPSRHVTRCPVSAGNPSATAWTDCGAGKSQCRLRGKGGGSGGVAHTATVDVMPTI